MTEASMDSRIDALLRRLDVPTTPDAGFVEAGLVELLPRVRRARAHDARWLTRLLRDLRLTAAAVWRPAGYRRLVVLAMALLLAAALLALLGLIVGSQRRLPFGGSETIGFFRTDVTREVNTQFIVNRDGSHETQLGHDVGVLSPDGTKLLTVSEGKWARPAVSNMDGSDLKVLDAYPGLEMQLLPIAWSPDMARILVATGGRDITPSGNGLYTVRSSDEGDLVQLVLTPEDAGDIPHGYSADGSEVLLSRTGVGAGILLVGADGRGLRRLSPSNLIPVDLDFWDPISADWSADGSQVAFAGFVPPDGSGQVQLKPNERGAPALYVVNRDGTGRRTIVSPELGALSARWSPLGNVIAFTSGHLGNRHTPAGPELLDAPQVWLVNSDGSNLRQLTDGAEGSTAVTPVWSPDGSELLFQRKRDDAVTLWIMNSDGSGQRQLTAPVAADYVGEYGWPELPAR
jgi:dipeptidyl aminopeptidase/acylaminoacyl peptidase